MASTAAFRQVHPRRPAAGPFLNRSPRSVPPTAGASAEAARLRALADELDECGSVQTAAICRQMADEVEGR